MKILKIDGGKGYFLAHPTRDFKEIHEIDKTSLLSLVNLVIGSETELDAYDASKISNQAHQIIYESIYKKLLELQATKKSFKDEADRMYMEDLKMYSQSQVTSGEA